MLVRNDPPLIRALALALFRCRCRAIRGQRMPARAAAAATTCLRPSLRIIGSRDPILRPRDRGVSRRWLGSKPYGPPLAPQYARDSADRLSAVLNAPCLKPKGATIALDGCEKPYSASSELLALNGGAQYRPDSRPPSALRDGPRGPRRTLLAQYWRAVSAGRRHALTAARLRQRDRRRPRHPPLVAACRPVESSTRSHGQTRLSSPFDVCSQTSVAQRCGESKGCDPLAAGKVVPFGSQAVSHGRWTVALHADWSKASTMRTVPEQA